jgi:hypothetical protein
MQTDIQSNYDNALLEYHNYCEKRQDLEVQFIGLIKKEFSKVGENIKVFAKEGKSKVPKFTNEFKKYVKMCHNICSQFIETDKKVYFNKSNTFYIVVPEHFNIKLFNHLLRMVDQYIEDGGVEYEGECTLYNYRGIRYQNVENVTDKDENEEEIVVFGEDDVDINFRQYLQKAVFGSGGRGCHIESTYRCGHVVETEHRDGEEYMGEDTDNKPDGQIVHDNMKKRVYLKIRAKWHDIDEKLFLSNFTSLKDATIEISTMPPEKEGQWIVHHYLFKYKQNI